jgi:hypothetical protein
VNTDPYFEGRRLCDENVAWFQYLVEWGTAGQSAQKEFEVGDIVQTMDIFQQGPFHPNFPGQQAFLRALTDSIRNMQRVEIRDDGGL